MIEFSCHTWSFNDLTLAETMGTIARLGFRYVDIGSGVHLNLIKAVADPRRVAAEIISDLRVYNLQLADLYVMLPNIASTDEAKRRHEIELFKTLIPFIKAIGARGVTVSPGIAPEIAPDATPDDAEPVSAGDDEPAEVPPPPDPLDLARSALLEMIDVAEDLPLSIEPHLDSVAPTPEKALQLVEDVPGLSITLDWAHMVCQNIKQAAMLDLLPHTRHVHMRQAARNKLQTDWNHGKIDINQVVSDLLNERFDGVISIEYMKAVGWHGMTAVNTIQEVIKMRDALRTARDTL